MKFINLEKELKIARISLKLSYQQHYEDSKQVKNKKINIAKFLKGLKKITVRLEIKEFI